MKKAPKILSIIFQCILFITLLSAVFTFFTSKTSIFASIRSMVVLTGSMEPTFPVGSVVYIKPQIAYAIGDSITFKNTANQHVTHRIVDFTYTEKGTAYTTKGDANTTPDKILVASDAIAGKVFFSIPFIGKLIAFLNSPAGFLAFIITPTLLVIGMELWNIKKEIEKSVEKRMMEKLQQQEHRYFITS